MSRRSALAALGVLGAGAVAAVVEVFKGGSMSPKPVIAAGTVRHPEAYGTTARQVGEWWVPGGASGLLPTIVLVHGGYWRSSYDLHLEDAVAADLAGRGYLVWNIDYAPSSDPWPATLTDAALGYDFTLTGAYAKHVDPKRLAVVGHSAGGHLALWLASRSKLPAGAPGAGTHVTPALSVGQAPVASFANAEKLNLGGGAVQALLQGDQHLPLADPLTLAPSGVRTVLIHGTSDDIVPISQSEDYLAKATDCTLDKVPGDHFIHLDPKSEAIAKLHEALATL